MNSSEQQSWAEQNQCYLLDAIRVVNRKIENHLESTANMPLDSQESQPENQASQTISPAPALQTLCQIFSLSSFERSILLLCAGVELDTHCRELISTATTGLNHNLPTFNLALAVFDEPHWSALTPEAPLRRWRLIETGSAEHLMHCSIKIDEKILHYLAGVSYLDPRLRGIVKPVDDSSAATPSADKLVKQIVNLWTQTEKPTAQPMIQLTGASYATKLSVTLEACQKLGLQLYTLHGADIPDSAAEREALSRLWEREAALMESVLLVNHQENDHQHHVTSFVDDTRSLLIVASNDSRLTHTRDSVHLETPESNSNEQLELWRRALGAKAHQFNGKLEQLAWQFQIDEKTISSTCRQLNLDGSNQDLDQLGEKLWQSCRLQTRRGLDELAQRIEPVAHWEDIVLPQAQLNTLRQIAIHLRQRARVYEDWGFAKKSARGLGISALFAGPSGTGKTMAAEVLANELNLDLFRIDLSQVVNKYIGETEKNLSKLFDAAERSGAILLFDEADALFGKRSEVKDSHDRYSNIECSYLLQRMESYRGFACLTTNNKKALDHAFIRRIRFIVQFPFPDAAQRSLIWEKIFPQQTPTENLDINTLGKMDLTGGHIHNIAMNAAFLAAEAGDAVSMIHLQRAAASEYAKQERTPGTELMHTTRKGKPL